MTYTYPGAVDIRDGVENLRLKLDRIETPVKLLAEAVPMFDETAYRVVEGRTAGQSRSSRPGGALA
ncbi:hypothetical protein [Rhodobacter capsulatus]|uniref:hypothetical protein n=1 Tax=Rhodobacter capsulatus TaxID=1061 RepID=UPI004025DF89